MGLTSSHVSKRNEELDILVHRVHSTCISCVPLLRPLKSACTGMDQLTALLAIDRASTELDSLFVAGNLRVLAVGGQRLASACQRPLSCPRGLVAVAVSVAPLPRPSGFAGHPTPSDHERWHDCLRSPTLRRNTGIQQTFLELSRANAHQYFIYLFATVDTRRALSSLLNVIKTTQSGSTSSCCWILAEETEQ
jgi:hypothetical protein